MAGSFRSLAVGGTGHVSERPSADGRHGGRSRPARSHGEWSHRILRALLSGVSVRDMGGQDARRGACRRIVRDPRRGLNPGMFDAVEPLLLVGAGKMGGAMLDGWLDQGLTPERLMVLDPLIDADR